MIYRLRACIEITRPHNCVGAVLATYLGAYLAGGAGSLLTVPVLTAGLVVVLIVAASNVVNDMHDLPADQIQKPRRPLPSGQLMVPTAGLLALLLFLGGLLLAGSLGAVPFVIALFAVLLGIGYSLFLKSTVLVGNAVVGLLSGAVVMYGGVVVGVPETPVRLAALLVFGFVFLREILKTVADVRGDALVGVSTVATRLGPRQALRFFYFLALVLFSGLLLPWFLRIARERYLVAVSLGVVLPLMGVVMLLRWRSNATALRVALGVTKFTWFSGLLALAMMR